MRQVLPCGSPFLFEKNGEYFSFVITRSKTGWSYEAMDWLNYMSFDQRFQKPDGTYYTMFTALTEEHSVKHDSDNFKVDGYIRTETKTYFFEYRGCA